MSKAVLLHHVRASAVPRSESVLLRGGLVGYRLPPLHPTHFSIAPRDVMILTTDGVRDGFAARLNLGEAIQPMAERVLREYFRGNDDALVLAVRYLGSSDHA